jgi:hypothetical protein
MVPEDLAKAGDAIETAVNETRLLERHLNAPFNRTDSQLLQRNNQA